MNIVLIGNKSAGKSVVGQALSDALAQPMIDIDALLCEQQQTASCADLFALVGEEKFRQLESSLIQSLTVTDSIIITGGGSLLDEANAQHLKQLGKLVYLQVDFDTLQRRNAHREQHGVLNSSTPQQAQHAEREALFERYADSVIDCNDCSIDDVVGKICEVIHSPD